MLETLVLNTSAIPISIVPYRRILTRVCNNMAIVLKYYEGTCIRSAGCTSPGFDFRKVQPVIEMPIPSVIQCVHTNYMPKFTKVLPFTRMNVFIRDAGKCQYCGKKVGLNSFSFDHMVAKSKGGKTCWDNILLCCLRCNAKKGNKPVSKFKEPLRMPYTPVLDKAAPIHMVNKIAAKIPVESWQDYVYWSIILQD